MAYIGAEPAPGQNREVDDISSSFNGSTTAFTLQVSGVNVSPESANNILVNLGGVLQNPDTDYTINASTLTFTTAPASGLSFFALVLGAGINTATVADGAITTAKLASDAVGANQLANTSVTAGSYTTADITVDAQGRITAAASGTISGAEIADQAVTNAKVNNSAAIAGTKISPDFGSQNIVTTGGLTVDTTTLKVDASNNRVGIGTASPADLLHCNLAAENGSIARFGLSGQTNNQVFIIKADDSDSLFTFRLGSSNSTYPALRFNMGADSEAMRIKSDGKVLIGTSSSVQSTKLEVRNSHGSEASLAIANTNASYTGTIMLLHAERETTNNSYEFLNCRIESPNPGVAAFRLEIGDDGDVRNVNNSYGQVSDIRLKENIIDANSQWDDFKNLKFRSYNFKESTGFPTYKQIGLVAQEAETVCPNLIRTGKEDSNTKETYKFIKTSILYMKGMKALQEAIAKIETLETKVAALEAA